MKRTLMIFALVFTTCALLSSCGKKATESTSTEGSEVFPNSVGFQWTYEVYDDLLEATDTITVTITDTLTLTNARYAAVWVYAWADTVDTQYVAVVDDTVSIYPTRDTSFLAATYIFPLEVGTSWTYRHRLGNATSTVVETGAFSVHSGTYQDCFRIDTEIRGIAFDDFSSCSIWLAPKTGVLWIHLYEEFNYSLLAAQTWELIDLVSPSLVTKNVSAHPFSLAQPCRRN